MSSLVERFSQEPARTQVVSECVELIDNTVKQKGFVMKGAYATVKTLKKRFVPEVVDSLLNEWLTKLQPHYDQWTASNTSTFPDYVIAHSDAVAEDLLSVTDARAEKTSHTTAKKMYSRMRDSAKKNVVEAIPDLARLIDKHMQRPAPTGAPA